MLKIRFSRRGKKKQPIFRIVVAEHTAPIKGKFVENLGFYKPTSQNKEVVLKEDRISYWLDNGAKASDSVAKLLVEKTKADFIKKHKIDFQVEVQRKKAKRLPKKAKNEEAETEKNEAKPSEVAENEVVENNETEAVTEVQTTEENEAENPKQEDNKTEEGKNEEQPEAENVEPETKENETKESDEETKE